VRGELAMCRARPTCPFSDRLHAARLQEPGSALGPGTLRARVCSSGLPGANRGIQKHAQLLMETAGKAQFLIAGPIGLTAAAEPVRCQHRFPDHGFLLRREIKRCASEYWEKALGDEGRRRVAVGRGIACPGDAGEPRGGAGVLKKKGRRCCGAAACAWPRA
jgi:hypothetical protein